MLDNFLKHVQSQISERIVSPLMGSFVVSWCLWNYKFLVILFSSNTVSMTFDMIERIAFPNTWALLFRGMIFPTLTAAAYLFLYPYPARFVYEFSRMRQKEINDIRRRIEDETPLTIEESRKIRLDVLRAEGEFIRQLEHKNEEIERLKLELAEETKKNPVSRTVTNVIAGTILMPEQLELLRRIEKLGGRAPEPELLRSGHTSRTKVEYDLGELVGHGLLKRAYSQDDGYYVLSLTQPARKQLLDNPRDPRIANND